MTIRKRGNKYQVSVSLAGERIQRSADNEIEAKRLEPELLKELQDKIAGKEMTNWTLKTAVDRTFSLCWNDGKSIKTHKKNSNLMMGYFGKDTLLKDIDTDWVDQWVMELEEMGNSGATINRKLACLSKVITVAEDRGVITKRPKLQRRQEGTGRIRWLTFEEEDNLLGLFKSWSKDDHRDLTVFLLDTGCRPSEAYRLTLRDVNFEHNLVHFWETKSKVPRSIPLTLRVQEILKRRTQNTLKPFPWNDSWYRNQWDRAKNLMGLGDDKQFVPYCLRHTCASRMVQKGVPLAVIKEWLGHKTISITLRYAHLCPGSLQVGLQALERDVIPNVS